MISVKKRLLLRYGPLALILVSSLVAWKLGLHHHLTLENLRLHQKRFEDFVLAHLILSLLIYGASYVLMVALSLPVATFMTLLGGFLFGRALGTGVVVISATLGATLLFLSLRSASHELLRQRAGPWFHKMENGFQNNAFSYLLTLRLIPLFPFSAVNVVAAILQVPLKTFFWGTFLGIIPGTFVYVLMGSALQHALKKPHTPITLVVDPWILAALTGLGILTLLPALYKWLRKKHKLP